MSGVYGGGRRQQMALSEFAVVLSGFNYEHGS